MSEHYEFFPFAKQISVLKMRIQANSSPGCIPEDTKHSLVLIRPMVSSVPRDGLINGP